jgi:Ca-activated chloride channel family protein
VRFGNPAALHLLWMLLPLLALYWHRGRRREKLARAFAEAALLPRLAPRRSAARARLRILLFAIGLAATIVVLARPQFGSRFVPMRRKGIDLILALDTSLSMRAEDLVPDRLTRAKQEVQGLLDRLRGDRVGIIAFAGAAHMVCPLTLDYGAARLFLDGMDTDVISDPGTALSEAIREAREAFESKEKRYKVLVLLTDGEDTVGEEDPVEEARRAAEEGIKIFTVGVGTPAGEPIPIRERGGKVSGYKKDGGGNVVISRLDEDTLNRVALATGGKYLPASAGGTEMEEIAGEIASMQGREIKGGMLTEAVERFQVFAFLAFFVLLLESLVPERAAVRETSRARGPAPPAGRRREVA